MKPRERRERGEQDLFRSRLDQIINMDQELVRLAKTIAWRFIGTHPVKAPGKVVWLGSACS